MGRQISWLLRLREIRAAVEKSARTHYDRQEIEFLFQLRPTAAGQLMAVLPQVQVGRSRLVTRQALEQFLSEVEADPRMPTVRPRASRKLPRLLVRRELVEEGSLDNLPKGVLLAPGKLEVSFSSTMEALESLAVFVGAVQRDLEGFERHFVQGAGTSEAREKLNRELDDVKNMFEELRQMEAAWKKPASEMPSKCLAPA